MSWSAYLILLVVALELFAAKGAPPISAIHAVHGFLIAVFSTVQYFTSDGAIY